MAYEVKNIREVNYRRMSDGERKEVWRLNDLMVQHMKTIMDESGDYYALYEDVDCDADNDPDDRKYAVYLHNSGKLLCLLPDCAVALNGHNDTDYGNARSKLYRQIAIAAGWPEVLPKKRYTLRLMRECYVEVHADNHNQAWDIGERIAKIANEEYISDDFTYQVSSAVDDTRYEMVDAWRIEDEEGEDCELRLNAEECNRIMKED